MARFRYDLAGLVIDTSLALPDAREAHGARVDCTVDVLPLDEALVGDDGPWIRVERQGASTVIRFAGLAVFEVSPDRGRVVCRPAPSVPDDTVAHLLLDHVVPRLLADKGYLVVHASAVVTERGAVAFCGETGAGKSTLAASFALAGCPLLTDDALVLADAPDRPLAIATYPGIRLWIDNIADLGSGAAGARVAHYTEKRRLGPQDLDAAAFAVGSWPLAMLLFLDDSGDDYDGEITIRPMTARESFLALSAQAFRLEPDERAQFEAAFDQLARSPLLRSCARLCYPRFHERLPEVRAAILAAVSPERG